MLSKLSKTNSLLGTRGFSSQTQQLKPAVSQRSERDLAVDRRSSSLTSTYSQSAIDSAAKKASLRPTAASLLFSNVPVDNSYLIRSAQYLQKELPVRFAHRIEHFRTLPFAIAGNRDIMAVHEMYIKAFHLLSDFPAVKTPTDESEFSGVLLRLLDEHKDVVNLLAAGFRECDRHVKDKKLVQDFLDKVVTFRLGARMMCEHHLALRHSRPNSIGVLSTNFSPATLVTSRAARIADVCRRKFGAAPSVQLDGDLASTFSYISQPVEYIVCELLKNAFRATVEHNAERLNSLPPVKVTVANNAIDFVICVSDLGGGVPHSLTARVFEYNFTTADSWADERESYLQRVCASPGSGQVCGFGFGLPTSRAYAEYLGGSLTLSSMQGHGSDFYLRLLHLNGSGQRFRI